MEPLLERFKVSIHGHVLRDNDYIRQLFFVRLYYEIGLQWASTLPVSPTRSSFTFLRPVSSAPRTISHDK